MPSYFSKSLATASSTAVATISTAATPVVTLSSIAQGLSGASSIFDTQRRLVLWSTGGSTDFSAAFTITGTRQGGGTVTETINGSTTGTAVNTTQDFLTITSVSVSSVLQVPVTIGTATVGGTPWQVVNTGADPTNIGFGLTYSTTRTTLLGQVDLSYDSPMLVNPNSTWGQPFPIGQLSTSLGAAGANGISSATNTNGVGFLNFPVAAWRFTVTSTSTQVSSPSSLAVYLSAVQVGLGSGG